MTGNRNLTGSCHKRQHPEAPNHKLETLVRYRGLHTEGIFHRALADAEMTALLWVKMIEDLRESYGFETVSFAVMCGLMKVSKARVADYLCRCA